MTTLSLVDFHCHLDLFPDPASAVASTEAAAVYALTVTTTPKAWPVNRELTKGLRFVRAALGLHPQLVAERANEFAEWELHLSETRYIGEVGLDAGPHYLESLDLQKRVFRSILERCAEAGGKVLTVHSVRSASAVLDMIEAYLPSDRGTVVLHWFTGSRAEASRAVELGCYFSINGQMTRTAHGRRLIAGLPAERLLTETDSPFTKIDGRAARPTDVALAVQAIAGIRESAPHEIGAIVKSNLARLLSSGGPQRRVPSGPNDTLGN